MAPIRFAFAGFRHGHIMSLLAKVRASPETTLVAACEEDAATRAALAASGNVQVTHTAFTQMLAEMPCDVVAIGDVYAKRGPLAIQALEAGKHVILDKPVCVRLDELERLEALARARGLAIGCQLDLRSGATRQTLRRLVLEGAIGEVLTVAFCGQHPLLLGSRPAWYFEKGRHGGTLNDIAIHAVDGIPWLTGHELATVVAARVWNGKTPQFPWFQDCAQCLLTLDHGGGVLGDVSYLAPDRCGYSWPGYWRITIHGSLGVAEIQTGEETVRLATHADKTPRSVAATVVRTADYFDDFLAEIRGTPEAAELTTARVLRSARQTLLLQQAADEGRTGVAL